MPLFLALLATLQALCDPGQQKQGILAAEAAPWFSRHAKDCTLCADGSACREGWERRMSMRRAFQSWRAGHAAAGLRERVFRMEQRSATSPSNNDDRSHLASPIPPE